ncbi:hypothetical protein GCM10009841_29890 [Microlunatus panaciterrae]|uniref:DUF3618 domain-containing protein n=1 Tax=Microlunatus panaciterrae TaxID=400768 RepID=A0ABS2RF80_9ACTN|nr:DUF3618 domain-containing protein [Microlunatus panaciterrae]MBM7797649.1 hypothetical protein [Microlunatus panaciterrae]
MSEHPSRPAHPGDNDQVADIEADLARSRQELGDTVEALAAKLDVKEQARRKAADLKTAGVDKIHRAQHKVTETQQRIQSSDIAAKTRSRTALYAGITAAAVAGVVLLIIQRRR